MWITADHQHFAVSISTPSTNRGVDLKFYTKEASLPKVTGKIDITYNKYCRYVDYMTRRISARSKGLKY